MNKFRKVCRWLHRELAFVAVGLTLAYAISGVAVNHIDSWNPNYELVTEQSPLRRWRRERPPR